eukprot:scaffold288017_cov17-Prasinocladus_malaysianus.AAC.1
MTCKRFQCSHQSQRDLAIIIDDSFQGTAPAVYSRQFASILFSEIMCPSSSSSPLSTAVVFMAALRRGASAAANTRSRCYRSRDGIERGRNAIERK